MTFSHNDILKKHIKTHSEDKPYHCNHCDMSFSQINLITHIMTHAGDQPYPCAEFQNPIRTHTGPIPDQCSNCGKTFSCAYSINYRKTHTGKKSHLCSSCENYISVIQPVSFIFFLTLLSKSFFQVAVLMCQLLRF